MREYKFRVYFENKFYYFTLDKIMARAITYQGDWDIKALRAEKQQCSGVIADNKEWIYEGDIVTKIPMLVSNEEPFIGIVKFEEGVFWIDNGTDAKPVFTEVDSLKIIGNIYENPEFLTFKM